MRFEVIRSRGVASWAFAITLPIALTVLNNASNALGHDIFATASIPIVIVAYFGGTAPALVATVTALLSYLLFSNATWLGLVAFALDAALTVTVFEALHRTRRRLQDAQQKLQASLKDTSAQLRHAQKMDAVGRLAGGVAHDFNNILSAILMNAELVAERIEEDRESLDGIDEIRKAGVRAAQLTKQLLVFSRQRPIEKKVVDINDLTRNVSKMLVRLVGEDVDLKLCAAPTPIPVSCDPSQIEQVLMNLAVNARDAMPLGGALTVETSILDLDESFAASHHGVTAGQHAMIAVSDNGTGMDTETLNRIFEPFFTTKPEGKGTGLGLSICWGIVEAAGGTIWVYSEVGRGTTFKVYLPLAAGTEITAIETRSAPRVKELATGRVLVVEDDDQLRAVVATTLARSGYTVTIARNGTEAIDLSKRSGEIDLVLCDVIMPGLSGRDVAESLAVTHPKAQILFMSGYTDNVLVNSYAFDRGIAFVQKPISPASLLKTVHEVLGQKGQYPLATFASS